MGFDSFGLPAEQYAIKTGKHPKETTKKILIFSKNNLIQLDYLLIGTEKLEQVIANIINGLNGYF